MCNFFSCIVTKVGDVLFTEEDSHEEAISRSGLQDNLKHFVRVEYATETGYKIYESLTPEWYERIAAKAERDVIATYKALSPAWEEYEKVKQSAWEEYEKVQQSAREEYEKVKQSAWEEYEKVQQSAREECEKVQQSAWEEYEKVKQSAREEYEKVQQSAWVEYEKVKQSARVEYEKVKQSAREEYKNATLKAPGYLEA